MRKLLASLCVTALLAVGVVSTAAAQQTGDGLVVVQIENVLNDNVVNVVVPIDVAAAIAANVCGVDVTAAVLGAIDQAGASYGPVTCDSKSRAFNGGDLIIVG